MLNSISTLLRVKKRTTNKQPPNSDIKLATASLMLEVIRADGKIGRIELIAMSEVLKRQFKLQQYELNSLIEKVSHTYLSEIDLKDITHTICQTWGNAKRLTLLENLWIVALADQHIDTTESDLVRKLASQLCLNEMQIFQSQESAKSKLGIEDF